MLLLHVVCCIMAPNQPKKNSGRSTKKRSLSKTTKDQIASMPEIYHINTSGNGVRHTIVLPIKHIPPYSGSQSLSTDLSNDQVKTNHIPLFQIGYMEKNTLTPDGLVTTYVIHVHGNTCEVLSHGISPTNQRVSTLYRPEHKLPRPRSHWYWRCKLQLVTSAATNPRSDANQGKQKNPRLGSKSFGKDRPVSTHPEKQNKKCERLDNQIRLSNLPFNNLPVSEASGALGRIFDRLENNYRVSEPSSSHCHLSDGLQCNDVLISKPSRNQHRVSEPQTHSIPALVPFRKQTWIPSPVDAGIVPADLSQNLACCQYPPQNFCQQSGLVPPVSNLLYPGPQVLRVPELLLREVSVDTAAHNLSRLSQPTMPDVHLNWKGCPVHSDVFINDCPINV